MMIVLPPPSGNQVICRSGSMHDPDLRKVSAESARAVIVLADQDVAPDQSDSKALRTVLW